MGPPPFGGGNFPTFCCTSWPPILQWGHRLSVVETLAPYLCPLTFYTALQWGHPLSAVETKLPTSGNGMMLPSFNGATAFRWWKLGSQLPGRRRGTASMGPPPFGGGNRKPDRQLGRWNMMLQWGHRLSVVETTSRRHWNTKSPSSFNGATAFRWWKLADRNLVSNLALCLQWGHRLSVVETTAPSFRRSWPSSFNGATAFRWWKPG